MGSSVLSAGILAFVKGTGDDGYGDGYDGGGETTTADWEAEKTTTTWPIGTRWQPLTLPFEQEADQMETIQVTLSTGEGRGSLARNSRAIVDPERFTEGQSKSSHVASLSLSFPLFPLFFFVPELTNLRRHRYSTHGLIIFM